MNAVIFDMDGLMFDTERLSIAAWDYAGEKIGLGKAGYMVMRTLGMTNARSMEILRGEFGDRLDEKALSKYSSEYKINFYKSRGVPVMKGLFELLEYLDAAGFKLAVASSTALGWIDEMLKLARVRGYFQAVVSGDMVERSKPEPDIYLKACEQLGERPQDCFALEDSRNGIYSAHCAGCKVIMVPDLWQPDERTERILFAKCESLCEAQRLLSAFQAGVSRPQ